MKLVNESLDDVFLPKKDMLKQWRKTTIDGVANTIRDVFKVKTSYNTNQRLNPVILIHGKHLSLSILKDLIHENTDYYIIDISYSQNPRLTFIYLQKFFKTV